MAKDICAVILAGGRSSRFGTDKASVELGGLTLLERVLDVAAPLVDDVLVVGPWAPAGVRTVLEDDRFAGPLAGLVCGLENVEQTHALTLACDHPLLAQRLLRALLDRRHEAAAVVARTEHGPQPLVAVYDRDAARVADRVVAQGKRSLHAFVDAIDEVLWLDRDDWRRFDPSGRSFLDVDDAGDYARIARMLG